MEYELEITDDMSGGIEGKPMETVEEILIKGGIKPENIKKNERMSEYTSFKAGGPAELLVEPDTVEELQQTLRMIKKINVPLFILGKGTNLLVSDSGIPGIVLRIGEKLSGIKICETEVIAEAGCLLSVLSKAVGKEGLTGLEFASGIPGTLGGSLAMNAGAYDGELKDFVKWVEVLDQSGELKRLTAEEMEFSYRHSCLEEKGYIAIRGSLELSRGIQCEIDEKMNDFACRRRTKQPLALPSAGSTFKRPPGHFAGKLIEEAGLKGYRIGGASVSELHCGFVVSDGTATATEIYELIRYIQKRVKETAGIELKTEVKFVGAFS